MAARKPRPESGATTRVTYVVQDRHALALEAVALVRKGRGRKGRASASAVLAEILERHIVDLEREGRDALRFIQEQRRKGGK
jgi:hypothetical protein